MTRGVTLYPAMRHSGVPWLGTVPTHWERRRLKSLLRLIDRRSSTGTETLLSLRRDHGIVVYSEHFSRPAQGATTVGYKIVDKGQLVVNRLQANNGLVFDSALDGLVSPDYSVFEARAQMVMRYLSLLLRTATYRDHFRRESTGLGTGSAGFLRLYDDRLLETPVVLPPIGEQTAILRFLDYADRRIRRYIRAKQRLINLLEEQKRALVHRIVTRGLDPNVRLKPSGVEWVGDVPEHWEVRKLRQCASITGGMTPSMDVRRYWDGNIPWVTPKDMKQTSLGDSSIRVTEDAIRETSLHLIPAPAVLMVVRGMILARKVPVAWTTAPVTVNQDMKALVPGPGLDARFLAVFLSAAKDAFVPLIDEAGHGTRRLPTERWRDLLIMLPPQGEQAEIVLSLDGATSSLERAVVTATSEISTIREYRSRLIADLVTGKLDVREAAARLPEDVEEPGEADEVDAEADIEESAEEVDLADAEAEA